MSLIDTKSIVEAFANKESLVKQYNITTKKLVTLKPLRLINDILSSYISKYFTIRMIMRQYTKLTLFYVTKLCPLNPIILSIS